MDAKAWNTQLIARSSLHFLPLVAPGEFPDHSPKHFQTPPWNYYLDEQFYRYHYFPDWAPIAAVE
jgi:hypothetical protein